jgi:uncharacterized coiled-coil protein SlyX
MSGIKELERRVTVAETELKEVRKSAALEKLAKDQETHFAELGVAQVEQSNQIAALTDQVAALTAKIDAFVTSSAAQIEGVSAEIQGLRATQLEQQADIEKLREAELRQWTEMQDLRRTQLKQYADQKAGFASILKLLKGDGGDAGNTES